MSNEQLQAAYATFAKRVGRMLTRKGARRQPGFYHLRTPGGMLIIQVRRNWLFCRFENALAGFILTHGLCQPDSGVWNTNFADDAATLTNENTIHHAEIEIDSFLTRTLNTDEQAVAFSSGKLRGKLHDAFLENFGRLQSVNMAAREAVASVEQSASEPWPNCQAFSTQGARSGRTNSR